MKTNHFEKKRKNTDCECLSTRNCQIKSANFQTTSNSTLHPTRPSAPLSDRGITLCRNPTLNHPTFYYDDSAPRNVIPGDGEMFIFVPASLRQPSSVRLVRCSSCPTRIFLFNFGYFKGPPSLSRAPSLLKRVLLNLYCFLLFYGLFYFVILQLGRGSVQDMA